jgi:methionyl-tRNA formyltransferase
MTEKGYRVLDTLVRNYPYVIECVVTSRDLNIENDYYKEICEYCNENQIDVCDRAKFRNVTSRYAVAVSWRWLIDEASTTLVVFHDSILPKYRGFSPLVSALINGDDKVGVTALFATKEYDRGDIIFQSTSLVTYPIKIQQAIELVNGNYNELALKIAEKISNGDLLIGEKQNEEKASYSLWRDEDDYIIDWEQSSDQIKRFIDAVGYPYKGASTMVDGKKARIVDASIVDDVSIENRIPGKVIFVKQGMPVIVCRKGLLMITDIVDNETGNQLLPLSKFRTRMQ